MERGSGQFQLLDRIESDVDLDSLRGRLYVREEAGAENGIYKIRDRSPGSAFASYFIEFGSTPSMMLQNESYLIQRSLSVLSIL